MIPTFYVKNMLLIDSGYSIEYMIQSNVPTVFNYGEAIEKGRNEQ